MAAGSEEDPGQCVRVSTSHGQAAEGGQETKTGPQCQHGSLCSGIEPLMQLYGCMRQVGVDILTVEPLHVETSYIKVS